MGTNYYAVLNLPTATPKVHLGKSSGGWAFSLRQDPDLGLWDWPAYKKLADHFEDEYGDVLNADQMEQVVYRRGRCAPPDGWARLNNADGCVGRHPTEPVDYVQGEFS